MRIEHQDDQNTLSNVTKLVGDRPGLLITWSNAPLGTP